MRIERNVINPGSGNVEAQTETIPKRDQSEKSLAAAEEEANQALSTSNHRSKAQAVLEEAKRINQRTDLRKGHEEKEIWMRMEKSVL